MKLPSCAKLSIGLMTVSIAIIALCAPSCRSSRTLTPVRTDSTIIVERWRDSVVTIPADSAWLKAWLECDSAGSVLLHELEIANGRSATMTVVRLAPSPTGSVMEVGCNTDSLELLLRIREQTIERLERSVNYIETEKPLTWWQATQTRLGRLFMIVVAVLAVLLTIKRFLK